ncbi:MAG: hypothetical protein ACRDPA_24785 [Solirubrobacteraceae bacterium]
MERASRTAIVLAQFRAAHVFDDPEPIFEDTLALELAGLSEADVREFFAANIPPSCAHLRSPSAFAKALISSLTWEPG